MAEHRYVFRKICVNLFHRPVRAHNDAVGVEVQEKPVLSRKSELRSGLFSGSLRERTVRIRGEWAAPSGGGGSSTSSELAATRQKAD